MINDNTNDFIAEEDYPNDIRKGTIFNKNREDDLND